MTKPARLFLAALALCTLWSQSAFGQTSVSILNNDGTITASGGNDLTLSGSTLAGVSDLGMGDDCPPPACSGTVDFTTGHTLTSGTLTTNAMFGPGGTFTVTSTSGSGGGFTFAGSFSSASWTKSGSGSTAFWSFVGTIANGTLTLKDGQVFSNINGATIDLTTLGGPKNVGGFNAWTDSGGTTTFLTPTPEPGALTLLGTGLVGLGVLARRGVLMVGPRNKSRL